MSKKSKDPQLQLDWAPEIQEWWHSVTSHYELKPHHLHLLELACEALHRGNQAREQVQKEGMVVADRNGSVKAHPCLRVEKEAAATFMRLLKQLDFDDPGDHRPPRMYGGYQVNR